MSYLNYTPWEHYRDDKSNSAPCGADENGLAIGLELEIAHFRSYGGINSAIDDGLVETSDSGRAFIQLEEEAQGNVDFELVFNADDPARIISRLIELNQYIGGQYRTHRECSAHVHIGRDYLRSIGIKPLAFYRAAEAIAPFIYAISGRDSDCFERWSEPRVDYTMDIINRFKYIDEAQPRDSGSTNDRYELCNMTNDETVEIRGFSNFYDCHVPFITAYIAVVKDLIPAIAAKMDGKTYKSDYKIVLKEVAAFIEDYELADSFGNLTRWINWEAAAREAKRQAYNAVIDEYQHLQAYLNEAHHYAAVAGKFEAAQKILNFLARCSSSNYFQSIEADSIELTAIKQQTAQLEDKLHTAFKNAVWRL